MKENLRSERMLPQETLLSREIGSVSIRERDAISAPLGYMSMYHETTREALDDIDSFGLHYDTENYNFMDSPNTEARTLGVLNRTLEKLRPEWARDAGLDRRQVIYGYLDVEKGHRMGGYADEVFHDRKHKDTFEQFQKYNPQELERLGVTTWEEWKASVLSEIQETGVAGAVLELKVDPNDCYVGDMHHIEEARYPELSQEMREERLQTYWDSVIPMRDLQKWYRVPNEDENMNTDLADPTLFKGYAKLKEAPQNLPDAIDLPEVLVTKDIPQKHIRMIA